MKKLIILAIAVLTLAPAHAQFSLNKNGQAVFGKRMSTITLPSLQGPQNPQNVIVGGNLATIDSLASCVFLGKKSANLTEKLIRLKFIFHVS